jgi:hypothetical protein
MDALAKRKSHRSWVAQSGILIGQNKGHPFGVAGFRCRWAKWAARSGGLISKEFTVAWDYSKRLQLKHKAKG